MGDALGISHSHPGGDRRRNNNEKPRSQSGRGAMCALVSAPTKAQDQDCGVNCQTCMVFGKEGYNYNKLGNVNMSCMFQSNCALCVVERAGSGADAEALLTLIKTGAANDVR